MHKVNLKNDEIFLTLIAVGVFLSLEANIPSLLLGMFAIILFRIFRSRTSSNYYLILFLLPNLRMFDSTGVAFLVNILIFVCMIKYVFFDYKSTILAMFFSIVFLFIEFSHYYVTNDITVLIQTVSWIASFALFVAILTDKKILLNRKKAFWYLCSGILTSASISIFTQPHIDFISAEHRLTGLAGDPNFLSLYILLAIFSIPNVLWDIRGIPKKYFLVYFLLVFLGLMTSSKMFLLTYSVITLLQLIYSFTSVRKDIVIQRKFISIILGLSFLILLMFPSVGSLIQNVINRFFIDDFSDLSSDTINLLSSGRGNLVSFYIKQLTSDAFLLLFGYGRSYHLMYGIHLAHNTYLDIILSWGVIGSFVFYGVLLKVIELFKRKSNKDTNLFAYLPLLALLIIFTSLSAFEADMFFFVVSYAFIQTTTSSKNSDELATNLYFKSKVAPVQ